MYTDLRYLTRKNRSVLEEYLKNTPTCKIVLKKTKNIVSIFDQSNTYQMLFVKKLSVACILFSTWIVWLSHQLEKHNSKARIFLKDRISDSIKIGLWSYCSFIWWSEQVSIINCLLYKGGFSNICYIVSNHFN